MIVFNKSDLADSSKEKSIIQHFTNKKQLVEFSNATNSVSNIRQKILQLVNLKPNSSRTILICGIPNVGKSTILNSLKISAPENQTIGRNTKVAKTGPLPGVTRSVTCFKIIRDPPIYVLDTPGVMLPTVPNSVHDIGLKLALTGNHDSNK